MRRAIISVYLPRRDWDSWKNGEPPFLEQRQLLFAHVLVFGSHESQFLFPPCAWKWSTFNFSPWWHFSDTTKITSSDDKVTISAFARHLGEGRQERVFAPGDKLNSEFALAADARMRHGMEHLGLFHSNSLKRLRCSSTKGYLALSSNHYIGG